MLLALSEEEEMDGEGLRKNGSELLASLSIYCLWPSVHLRTLALTSLKLQAHTLPGNILKALLLSHTFSNANSVFLSGFCRNI